ncbi:MAG: glycosyltransferase family 2 protein [Pyrinomonadaceae bacterium]|nr:glycosyltransferase family 2 protein [Pyrinomonadaceae bacterium]
MTLTLPISAIVPTRERATVLNRMLLSLAAQSAQPVEMIVVDASRADETEKLCGAKIEGLATRIEYHRATATGAATQRSQAIAHARQDAILFLDDDIVFEADCILHLWEALESDARMGGASAMITNQRYFPPGRLSRTLFRVLHGRAEETYAGLCIGPAFNLLPEDREDLPEVVPVEWLNTTCTLYRRKALPQPLFDSHFTGYSLMEDVTLSLKVGRKWRLANARLAKIFHDSQPGAHKNSAAAVARMELVNRHYVMTRVLGRRSFSDYLKLGLYETFGIVTSLSSISAWRTLPAVLLGKLSAVGSVLTTRDSSEA